MLHCCSSDLFPDIYFLLIKSVIDTLSVSTPMPERSYSTLKLVKTFLWNATRQIRLKMPLLYKVLIEVVLNKFVIKYTIILYDKHHWDRDDKINTNYYFSAYTYVCECVTQSVKCKISVIFDTIYTLYTYLYIIYM